MRVKSLLLKNVRAIESATFRFAPGFNLLWVPTESEKPVFYIHWLSACLL